MVQFNPDGSLKLPDRFAKAKQQEQNRFLNTPSIKITKKVTSFYSPKKCLLTIELSPKLYRNDFVQNIYNYFSWQSETPTKLIKQTEKEFHVEIGTSFRRCSECTSLIGRYREYNDGNLILKKGNCPLKEREMAFEDYFD